MVVWFSEVIRCGPHRFAAAQGAPHAIRLELPASVEAKVIEAPEALRGDTAGNVLKPVTISSGITIQVPLFIKKDDVIKISTSDRSYLGRVN